jgi:hypothetical protein
MFVAVKLISSDYNPNLGHENDNDRDHNLTID